MCMQGMSLRGGCPCRPCLWHDAMCLYIAFASLQQGTGSGSIEASASAKGSLRPASDTERCDGGQLLRSISRSDTAAAQLPWPPTDTLLQAVCLPALPACAPDLGGLGVEEGVGAVGIGLPPDRHALVEHAPKRRPRVHLMLHQLPVLLLQLPESERLQARSKPWELDLGHGACRAAPAQGGQGLAAQPLAASGSGAASTGPPCVPWQAWYICHQSPSM